MKGVNLGATVPGHFPGEFPVDEETYLRWFRQIHDMGAMLSASIRCISRSSIRRLVKFNREEAERPLYFIQGIWSPEEQLIEKQDAYLPEIQQEFKQEIEKAVKAVYGDLDIPSSRGQQGGSTRRMRGSI